MQRCSICILFFWCVSGQDRVCADAADGVYGRFDGDLSVNIGLGGGASWRSEKPEGTLVGELRVRYLDAAGPFIVGRWGPSASQHLAFGVEMRPLFPGLFLEDRSFHREWLDLFIQSFGVDLGIAIPTFGSRLGVGWIVGWGMELPVVRKDSWDQDVWLRIGARFLRAAAEDRAGPNRDLSEWTLYATVVVRFVYDTGLAAWEPPRHRK